MKASIFVVLAVIICLAHESHGYEYIRTINDIPVRWDIEVIDVVLDDGLTAFGAKDDVFAVFQSAFNEWTDKADLPIEFDITWGECVQDFIRGGSNIACVSVSDTLVETDTAATTFLVFNREDAFFDDTDIVFYLDAADWTLDDTDVGKISVRHVAIHEIGHVLGMGHSDDTSAIMYSSVSPIKSGSVIALHQDDIDGVNALYSDFEPSVSSCSVVAVGTCQGGLMMPWWLIFVAACWVILRFFV